ncbi:MAG: hypothetical protein AAF517_28735 [Planctomycetota bacterium]
MSRSRPTSQVNFPTLAVISIVAAPSIGFVGLAFATNLRDVDAMVCQENLLWLHEACQAYVKENGALPQIPQNAGDHFRKLLVLLSEEGDDPGELVCPVGRRDGANQAGNPALPKIPDYEYLNNVPRHSDQILAYCRHPHADETRLVVLASGRLATLTQEELKHHVQTGERVKEAIESKPLFTPAQTTIYTITTVIGLLLLAVAWIIFRQDIAAERQ